MAENQMSLAPKEKQEFRIDLSSGANSSLEALPLLANIDPAICYHSNLNLRLPLGIYNISVSRICDKLTKCSNKLESYFNKVKFIKDINAASELRQEIIDYIELSLYAAAEHVDDIKNIGKGLFENSHDFEKSKNIRTLTDTMKQHRSLVSASANAIKHSQTRIRIYSLEFSHDNIPMCLHGFFFEAATSGIIGPNLIFHHDDRQVFSVTSLLWEILVFLLYSSKALSEFLSDIGIQKPSASQNTFPQFNKAITAVARLPLYSFDEIHPFSNTRVIISVDDHAKSRLDSGLYGSISHRWSKSNNGIFGNFNGEFEGDGISRQFKIVAPKALNIQHWD